MATTYPAQPDTLITLPEVTQTTGLRPELFNRLREAIVRVEEELGPKPATIYKNVRERLDFLEYKMSNSLITISGDLGWDNVLKEVKVIGLGGNPIRDVTLVDGYVLNWDSFAQEWTPRNLPSETLAPPFAVIMHPLSPASTLVEVGETIHDLAFSAEYSSSNPDLDSVVLFDDQGNLEIDVTNTPNSFIYDGYSYTKSTWGNQVTITCRATNKRQIQKTSSVTYTWTQKLYWGISLDPGSYNKVFLESLGNSELTLSFQKTINVDASGSGNYIFFSCNQAYGTPTFNVNSMNGGFSKVGSVSIGMDTVDIYRSDYDNLGVTTVVIS